MAKDSRNLSQARLTQELFDSYENHKRQEIKSRRFTQTEMLRWLEPISAAGVVGATKLGHSAEGRPISLYTYGHGPTKVLLWSQMHGDEPTATMALLDILNYFGRRADDVVARTIRTNLALLIIPMLNPDGAERFSRRTAQLIDMNRDAISLRTPEAQILRDTQQKYHPKFGFNLHDQEPHQTVGSSNKVAAIALLAPARDQVRSDNDVRLNAKKVATVFAEVLDQLVPGHVAKYDDIFERRAFGDNIQLWGTSTVLVESGGWPNDREKMFIRKLNYVGLLVSLYSIATREYEWKNITVYESLPSNSENLYDIIVRGVELKATEGTSSVRVDIGINIEEWNQEPDRMRLMAKVVDVGDLSPYGAFEERDGKGMLLKSSDIQLDKLIPWEDLQQVLK